VYKKCHPQTGQDRTHEDHRQSGHQHGDGRRIPPTTVSIRTS